MSGRLTCLTSIALVLGLVGSASADLLGQWTFEDGVGTTAADISGNGLDAELFGDPAWDTAERHGGILVLDGADDFVVVEGSYMLPVYTIAGWFRVDGPGSGAGSPTRCVFGAYTASGGFGIYTSVQPDGTLRCLHRFPYGSGGGTNIYSETAYDDGQWYHMALVKSPDTMTLYVNGEEVVSVEEGTQFDEPHRLAFGVLRHDNLQRFFEGAFDDFRLYDHAMDASIIPSLMSADPFPQASGADPGNGAMLEATWASLSWRAGDFAASHDLYFGTNFDDVNDGTEGTFVGNLATTQQVVGFFGFPAPDGLQPGTTYYWRVDEVNDADPDSPWKGPVWSFWIQPRTAYNSSPADDTINVLQDVTLGWTPGMGASMHQVYFGDNLDDVANASGAELQSDVAYTPATLESGKTYYWRVDEFDSTGATHKGDVWSFDTVPEVEITNPDLVGWWTFDEGQGATAVDWSGHGHHGTIIGAAQWTPEGMDRGSLVLDGATNYVVVEGMLDSGVVLAEYTMAVWFRADRRGGARDLIAAYSDGSTFGTLVELTSGGTVRFLHRSTTGGTGADLATTATYDDGVWHHLAVVKTANELVGYMDGEVAVSEVTNDAFDGSFYVAFGVLDHLRANGRFFPGPLDDARIYDRALEQDEISEIMRGDPTLAADPSPSRGAIVDIRDATSLNFSAGDGAASHDVYFGTDKDAMESKGNQAGTSLSLTDLVEFGGGDYYWRIDEVAADGTVTAGTLWKFTVPDHLIVEDFESYNDLAEDDPESNRIYLTWIDGFGTTTNGAVAGNLDVPLMAPGRESAQAMPVSYDNAGKTSEATKTLVSNKDWTEQGVTKLVVWFSGDSANAADRMFVALGNAVVYHPDDAATQDGGWNEWVIDLQEFANQGTDLTNVGSITLGFGTRNAPVATGGIGTVQFDDVGLVR